MEGKAGGMAASGPFSPYSEGVLFACLCVVSPLSRLDPSPALCTYVHNVDVSSMVLPSSSKFFQVLIILLRDTEHFLDFADPSKLCLRPADNPLSINTELLLLL